MTQPIHPASGIPAGQVGAVPGRPVARAHQGKKIEFTLDDAVTAAEAHELAKSFGTPRTETPAQDKIRGRHIDIRA